MKTHSRKIKDLSSLAYRPRLIVDLNNWHLISVCSKIEVVVHNPVLTKNLQNA